MVKALEARQDLCAIVRLLGRLLGLLPGLLEGGELTHIGDTMAAALKLILGEAGAL